MRCTRTVSYTHLTHLTHLTHRRTHPQLTRVRGRHTAANASPNGGHEWALSWDLTHDTPFLTRVAAITGCAPSQACALSLRVRVGVCAAGCKQHFHTAEDLDDHVDTATMVPASVSLDGAAFGFPSDGTTEKNTCDELAAVGVDGVIRGVSSPIEQGFALGFIATIGEQVLFKYWNGKQKQEYEVKYDFTMTKNAQLGSFGKPLVLELGKAVASTKKKTKGTTKKKDAEKTEL